MIRTNSGRETAGAGPRAQARAASQKANPSGDDSWLLLNEVAAIISAVAALFLVVSFFSYQRGGVAANLGGPIGYGLANVVIQALGLAAYLLGPCLLALGWALFRHTAREISAGRVAGVLAFIISLAVALAEALPAADPVTAGGSVGGFVAHLLEGGFGRVGAALLVAALLALSFLFATATTFRTLATAAGNTVVRAWSRVGHDLHDWAGRRRRKTPLAEREHYPPAAAAAAAPVAAPENERRERARKSEPVIVVEPPPASTRRRTSARSAQQEFRFAADQTYQPPPLSFLDLPAHPLNRIDEDALRKSSEVLESKLADFGIEGKVVAVRPGPVITTYEVEPAPGVKVSRIVTLSDDLAMALRARGIRVLAPVPGKAVVGIEVANARREHVTLRALLDSEAFTRSGSVLSVALGKDAAGNPLATDLAQMPHLLVAGATGTGKSVSLNAMIVSILYRASPRDVRFVMVDLKMLELSAYEMIPHLLVPVVTHPKKAVVVLKNLAQQMDERYHLLKEKGVRNISSYNRLVAREEAERRAGVIELTEAVDGDGDEATDDGSAETAAPPPRHQHLPRIVVIVDELADLITTVGRQVEEPITRLAQKARAAGIHLILATQRPSVDVITGLIKANFPARISFRVTSRVDSRTILDSIGAERLLGDGDMLYLPPGAARPQRVHGGFVSEAEIHKIVEFVRGQGEPRYALDLLEGEDEEAAAEMPDEELDDELYDMAVRLVTESRQASISWVQRRLRIGYNRAARMIERMEKEGVVTTAEGGRPREVIAPEIEE